jgi:hypothetical protein
MFKDCYNQAVRYTCDLSSHLQSLTLVEFESFWFSCNFSHSLNYKFERSLKRHRSRAQFNANSDFFVLLVVIRPHMMKIPWCEGLQKVIANGSGYRVSPSRFCGRVWADSTSFFWLLTMVNWEGVSPHNLRQSTSIDLPKNRRILINYQYLCYSEHMRVDSSFPAYSVYLPRPRIRGSFTNVHLQPFQIVNYTSNRHRIPSCNTVLLLTLVCMLAQAPRKARMVSKGLLDSRNLDAEPDILAAVAEIAVFTISILLCPSLEQRAQALVSEKRRASWVGVIDVGS